MQFRQFCSELVRLREMVEQLAPASGAEALAESSTGMTEAPAARVSEVRSSLLSLLSQQSQRTTDIGGTLGYGLYREAEYVMAALADETFLNASWSERNHWQLLEQELFDTHASGDLFFRKLDYLLANGGTGSNDLAMIYFQALALDFRGRYRNADPRGQVERYRHQLYLRIYGGPADDDTRQLIFPETYEATAVDDETRRIPSAHLWWLVFGGVLLVWLVASTALWETLDRQIDPQLKQIESYSHLANGKRT